MTDVPTPPDDCAPDDEELVRSRGLLSVLTLHTVGTDVFSAADPPPSTQHSLFGGQVAAQALRAAAHTVDSARPPHSLHGHFLRPGLPGQDVLLRVERSHDGRSFSSRNVVASQGTEVIFTATASFQLPESGADFQVAPAALSLPPKHVRAADPSTQWAYPPFWPIEMYEYPAAPQPAGRGSWSTRQLWIRCRTRLPDDPVLHACGLTYLSDVGAMTAAMRAVPDEDLTRGKRASLNHAVWFHRPVRADEWLLWDLRPVNVGGARGLAIGTMHTTAGELVASVAQESLIRRPR